MKEDIQEFYKAEYTSLRQETWVLAPNHKTSKYTSFPNPKANVLNVPIDFQVQETMIPSALKNRIEN